MSFKKHHAGYVAFAESLGVEDVDIVRVSGGHPVLCGTVERTEIAVRVGSSSLGDWRTPLNIRSDIRNAVRRAKGFEVPLRHFRHMAPRSASPSHEGA